MVATNDDFRDNLTMLAARGHTTHTNKPLSKHSTKISHRSLKRKSARL
jgi:hypothetical protein